MKVQCNESCYEICTLQWFACMVNDALLPRVREILEVVSLSVLIQCTQQLIVPILQTV